MHLYISFYFIFALQVTKSIDINTVSKEQLILQVRDLQQLFDELILCVGGKTI